MALRPPGVIAMRIPLCSENLAHFGNFEFDLSTHELYRDGSRLKIRGHPVDVLAVLLEHPGELVTRETLRKRLWPNDTFVDFEQILNNSVGKLRDALGDNAESPHFIETLPRLGYRFIALVEKNGTNNYVAQTLPVAEARSAVPVTTDSSESHRISRRWVFWSMAACVVTAFAACGYWYVHTPLPAPRIAYYEQLTLDGTEKVARGTDGSRIYVQLMRPRRGIAQLPVSGGKVTEIPIDLPGGRGVPSALHAVSPDGSSLLVMNQFVRDEGFRAWVVGAQGHPARYLTRAYTAAWSPDGSTVLYVDVHGDFYTISSDGGEPRLLYREDAPASQIARTRDVSWSPDGTTIRFTRWGGKIFEMSSTGANFHEWLPGWDGSVQKCCGRWTADGQFFVFLAGNALAKGPMFRPLAQIWAADERRRKMRPRNGEPILLASQPLLWGNPVPSRDGTKIFARGVSLRGELGRYDSASKRVEPYLGGISADMLNFSRDGRSVAYVSFPDGILWRANRDGSGLVQLTHPPIYPRNPRWSPDGTRILFTSNTQNGVDHLYLVPANGGAPERLLPDDRKPQSLGDWSPDGAKVVYSTHRAFSSLPGNVNEIETRIIELANGNITNLPARPGGLWSPRWSPDGRYIAGQSLNALDLLVFDFNTGEWKVLFQTQDTGNHHWSEDLGFLNWSHDGQFIYFVYWNKENIGVYRVSIQGGKTELVFDFPQGFRGTGWYGNWMSLDPDDAPLVFRDVGTDEIYALTLDRK
jgi:Tol biopolymer transport system component/DNA-binding winged helix-turn-helix (wHTH) protein